jgi:hypothetical protein
MKSKKHVAQMRSTMRSASPRSAFVFLGLGILGPRSSVRSNRESARGASDRLLPPRVPPEARGGEGRPRAPGLRGLPAAWESSNLQCCTGYADAIADC